MKEKVISVFANTFGKQPGDIPDSLSQKDFAAWDSLQHLNLMVALEEAFGVEFEPDEIVEISSIQDILSVLKNKGV